jgi:nucleoside-diphosphate-sugar epimerase
MAGLHVVLGATGGAGSAVVRELASRGNRVRAVSRRGRGEALAGVEHVIGDALDPTSLESVCRGGTVVYHCANVPYQEWNAKLLPMARTAIAASAAAGAKLVVMDNLYMYDRVSGPMTEATPRNAQGKKGRLRVELEHLLLEAHRAGRVRVTIGRASDFYGPQANSAPMVLVVKPAINGRKASWLGRLDAPHTLSYLPDVGWGLVMLGEREESVGEIWHLPAGEPLTGRQFIELVFEELGRPPRMAVIRRPMLVLAGLFSPQFRESLEVLYQFEEPFVMDASKFIRAFGSKVTPHREAIRQTVNELRSRGS